MDKDAKCLAVYLVAGYHSRGVTGKEARGVECGERDFVFKHISGLSFPDKKRYRSYCMLLHVRY